MEKDKGIAKGAGRRILKLFKRRQPDTPSNHSGRDRPERAGEDTTPPNPHLHSKTERLESYSGSSPRVPFPDGAVSHDGLDATGNRNSTWTARGPPGAEQHPSSQSCQAPLADPKIASTSETGHEQPSHPLREQDKRALSQLGIKSLWKEAADKLDLEDQEKLDRLIESRREGHGESSPPSNHEDPSVDDVRLIFSRAEELKEEDKKAAWKHAVDKIVSGALAFKSLGDTAVQFDKSGYAALGWSVVSFGLQVGVNAKDVREFVFSSLEVVTGFMARYAQYEILYRGPEADGEFNRRLTNVYKAVLLYVMALNDYLQQCRAVRFVHAVNKLENRSVYEKKEAIDKADTQVKDWLPIIQTRTLNQLLKQSLPEPSQLPRDCLQSLGFLEMDSRSHDTNIAAAPSTCEWLLGHEVYTSWAACDRTLLWIKGKPGSGKSTLLRYALDNFMKVPNIGDRVLVLSFFFHGRGVDLQKEPLGLFRSLLHQVLQQVPDALPGLVAIFQQRCDTIGKPGQKWEWHLDELQGFFRSSLQKVLENRPVCLFIDALDECGKGNAGKLVKEFKSLLQGLPSTGLQFRICFTCRHYPILDLDYGLELCLEHENRRDISTYVQTQLSVFRNRMAATIPDLITKRASGVFMWARLVVERVLDLELEGKGIKRIEEAVNAIPPELDRLYQSLVQEMTEKADSLKLIQWICFAMRPLSLEELRWAMILDADFSYKSLQQCQSAEDYAYDNDTMTRRLKTLGRGLAEVVPSSNTQVVQFIHQSVKDFFVETGLSTLVGSPNSAEPNTFAVNLEGSAHYRLSRTCIRYLAMEEIAQSITCDRDDLMSTFPLLHYAVEWWIAHVKQSETREVSQDDLLSYFAWPSNALVKLWMRFYEIIVPYSNDSLPGGTSMVHVLSRHQMIGPLRVILQSANRVVIDAVDDNGRTPLSHAAEYGHEAIVKLLLDTGKVEADSKDIKGRTLLSYAAINGHETVVKLLLNTGKVEADSKDTDSQTPLLYAALNGYEAIVKLLLNISKVEADSKNKYSQTPLLYAALNGHETIVKLLLDTSKVEADSKDIEGRTPFSYAAENGYKTVVKLLLDTGKVEADSKNKYGRTPLSYAAKEGHEAVVKLLLDTGKVEADSKDIDGRTPLWYAAKDGHEAVIKLLLDTGKVEADSKDINSQTPLLYAALNGHEAIVKLLLDTSKVEADSKNKYSETPLLYAVLNGHETVVKLLLDTGKVEADSKDINGRTPLSHAAEEGHEAVVKLLLDTGKVEADSKDMNGRTPLSYADEYGQEVVIKLLQEREANIES